MTDHTKKANYLTIETNNLEITWHGPTPEEAPTLVFLHEGLGCVAMWNDFPARLGQATGCGVLVYSRLGYGKSDPCSLPRPLDFMHEEGLNVLPEILNKLKIKDCVLIGHSDGGSISIIYAGGTPALPLRGLITEAAHVFCENITVNSIQKAKVNYEQSDLREKLKKYHGNNVDCAFMGWNTAWLDPDFIHWNIEEYLPGIKVPFLCIQGEDDEYGTLNQVKSIESKASIHVETLILPECKHSPHRDQREATLQAMSDFILRIL